MFFVNLILLGLSAVVLIGLQQPLGFGLVAAGLLSVLITERKTTRTDLLLIFAAVGLLGTFNISTQLDYAHFFSLGAALGGLILAAILWVKYTSDEPLDYRLNWRGWNAYHYKYILFTLVFGSFLVPFYLITSQAYLNWEVVFETEHIIKLFIGTNALGLWDELFFISVIFRLLRRHTTLIIANLTQAVVFASFLYELGFTGWGPIAMYAFALIQGYTYEKTKSLGFVIVIHLLLDLILFFALLYLHANVS